jgi:ferric-dicitrate binding protein FerR (iron transport regulator)
VNIDPNIKELLHKFVLGQCTEAETEQVIAYCKANDLTDDFPTVEEVKALLREEPVVAADAAERMFTRIMEKAEEREERKKRRKIGWYRYAGVAASVAILLTVGWLYMSQNEPVGHLKAPVLTGNEITLQLENGDIQIISEDGTSIIKSADGTIIANHDKGKISYGNDTDVESLVYNTIKIPYGKRFELGLSDGTTVHLNSGTTMKYPVKFIKGQDRTVFVDGEAFFDVAKDKQHPFIVNADNLNVRVLGTHFNVSNYPEDETEDVVLVEGSVGLYGANEAFDAGKATMLEPGDKGTFSKNSSKIAKKQVTTQVYTAWIKGELVFRNMAFRNICRKLERRYNVTITNLDSKLANEKFNASFKDEPIDKVLGYFKELHGFTYTINKNKILIQ